MNHKELKRGSKYSEYSKTFAYQDDLLKAIFSHLWHFIKHSFRLELILGIIYWFKKSK